MATNLESNPKNIEIDLFNAINIKAKIPNDIIEIEKIPEIETVKVFLHHQYQIYLKCLLCEHELHSFHNYSILKSNTGNNYLYKHHLYKDVL